MTDPLQDGLAALQRITSAAERFDEPRPLFVSNEEIAALRALADAVERMRWRPTETAPRDGTEFLCLIDGLPYKAKFNTDGRFIWYWHSDEATGPAYNVYEREGRRLLEEIKPRDPSHYVPRGHLWVNGFDERKRTHWMALPPPPAKVSDDTL